MQVVLDQSSGLFLVVERTDDNRMRTLFARYTFHDAATSASVWLRRN